MMEAQSLEFRNARIERIETVFTGGQRECYLRVAAPLTRSLLALMGADYIRHDGREKTIAFDYGLQNLLFDLAARGLEVKRLKVACSSADRFKAVRKKDKAKGRITTLKFRLQVTADPKLILDYVMNIGGAEGVATLRPLQGDLFDVAPATIPAPKAKLKGEGAPAARRDGKLAAAGDKEETGTVQ